MAKNKYEEQHTITIIGTLDSEKMIVQVDDYGDVQLKDVFNKLNNELVSITIKKKEV